MAGDEEARGESPLNISFAGCGFLGIYHVGVIQCLRENAPSLIPRLNIVAGASAGALASLVLLSNCPTDIVYSTFIETAKQARKLWIGPFSPKFDIMGVLNSRFDEWVPSNAHRFCSGRLHISLTAVRDLKNVIVSDFNTRVELIKALKATCFIPVWAGFDAQSYRGKMYMDGGISNNMPTDFPGETITVSPFSGEADICPRDQQEGWDMSVNVAGTSLRMTRANAFRLKSALLPPHPSDLENIYHGGYDDCLRLLQSKGWAEETSTVHIPLPQQVSMATSTSSSASSSTSSSSSDEDMARGASKSVAGGLLQSAGDTFRMFRLPRLNLSSTLEQLCGMYATLASYASCSYAKAVTPSMLLLVEVFNALLHYVPQDCLRHYLVTCGKAPAISRDSRTSIVSKDCPSGSLLTRRRTSLRPEDLAAKVSAGLAASVPRAISQTSEDSGISVPSSPLPLYHQYSVSLSPLPLSPISPSPCSSDVQL